MRSDELTGVLRTPIETGCAFQVLVGSERERMKMVEVEFVSADEAEGEYWVAAAAATEAAW